MTARCNRPRAFLFSPAPRPPALPSPNPRCSRPMPAAWPWHRRRASPPSVSGPVPQALGSPHKTPRPPPKTLATLLFHSAAATPEREREEEVEEKSRARRRTTPPGAARGGGRRHPEPHEEKVAAARSFTRPAPRSTTPTTPRCTALLRLVLAPILRRTDRFPRQPHR
jgi:hypothetical protein